MKRRLTTILIVTLLIALSVYVPISFYPLNKIIIHLAQKRLDAKISCRSFKIYLWRSIIAKGLEAFGKGGFAIKADKVVIDYDLTSLVTGRLHLKCAFENARFYEASSIMNSLTDLLEIQPISDTVFHTISGDLYVGRNDTVTQDMAFLSENIKIYANAFTDREDNIRGSVYFFLNDNITNQIQEGVRKNLLHKEEGPWSSIYVGIMGNYKKPALRIMTDRFKMNIVVGRSH